jgi:hypothetical protein
LLIACPCTWTGPIDRRSIHQVVVELAWTRPVVPKYDPLIPVSPPGPGAFRVRPYSPYTLVR